MKLVNALEVIEQIHAEIEKCEVYDDYFIGRESGLLKAIQIIRNANGVGYLTPGGAIVPAGNARLEK
jgi:hypothetical protein